MTQHKQRIEVSPEMLAFCGHGDLPREGWPTDAMMLTFAKIEGAAPEIRLLHDLAERDGDDADVVLVVQRAAARRLFGDKALGTGAWHLTAQLRAAALAIRDCADGPAQPTLRLARSIELLCLTFATLEGGELVSAAGGVFVSAMDSARLAAARRLIDERWHEKLTLEELGRTCGLNRDKLTRGFRAIYGCTVADLLVGKRLEAARSLLLTTDLSVSSVGYRCGYLNNASFTRAFTRRHGLPPSQLRQSRLAA
jgi:AraC family transcriptional regulator, transcriptional activator of the genes for pyochelin and ferripyochelin receptors